MIQFALLFVLCVAEHQESFVSDDKEGTGVVDIGSQRELFVDDFLTERLAGSARLALHRPKPADVVFVCDRPWEGNTSAYFTVFQDGERYRMYYRGAHFDEKAKKPTHREVACYAESKDGIHWERPNLSLVDFNGSKENNIVWDGPGSHNFTPFKDDRPDCPASSRYKALATGKGGLLAFESGDGIHWKLMRAKPVITKGAFDSQNLAFWDAVKGEYREYHRGFRGGVRDIMTSTSKDFVNWSDPVFIDFGKTEREHLYTNAIHPYARAPHLLVGFPTRFKPATQQTEPEFMTGRDGLHFKRWLDPVIPVTAPKDRDGNRSNYMVSGILDLPKEKGLSVFGTEAYYKGPAGRVRRFIYRTDGFVSLQARGKGGEFHSRPLRFAGKNLELNFVTEKGGEIRVELRDEKETPLPGFGLEDCTILRGDDIAGAVSWKGGDLGKLAGRVVRMRIVLRDADVYSLRFRE